MMEDLERDYLKDVIYLQERILELEMMTRELMEDVREAARIIVIDKDKQLENGKIRADVLPF
jgi:hypothetical protein